MKNPIHRAKCTECKWDGLESSLTAVKHRGRTMHHCPRCGLLWSPRRVPLTATKSTRVSVLSYYAVEGVPS